MHKLVGALVAIMLGSSLSACGAGDDETVVMPAVKSSRLDIALSDIKRAGVEEEVEVVGGGVFGVIDESNWVVCTQSPAAGRTVSTTPRVVVGRSCDHTAKSATKESADTKPVAPRPQPKKTRGPRISETFVMPALVGMNLQTAQDTLQASGSYVLTQTDALGLHRFQVLDRDWKVCWQKPLAGSRVPLERLVDLGAVKLDERCP